MSYIVMINRYSISFYIKIITQLAAVHRRSAICACAIVGTNGYGRKTDVAILFIGVDSGRPAEVRGWVALNSVVVNEK